LGVAVFFVSVNQVLVRRWTCRGSGLSDRIDLPLRKVVQLPWRIRSGTFWIAAQRSRERSGGAIRVC
jgi:hypothetical protein